jgi:O-antigen ligase
MRARLKWWTYDRVCALVFAAGMPWGLSVPGLLMYMGSGIARWLRSVRAGCSRSNSDATDSSGATDRSGGTDGSDAIDRIVSPDYGLFRWLRGLVVERHPLVAAMNLLAIWLLVTSFFAENIIKALGATSAIIVTGATCFLVIIPSMLKDKKAANLALTAFVVSSGLMALAICFRDGLYGLTVSLRRHPADFPEVNRIGNILAVAITCSLLLAERLPARLKAFPWFAGVAQTGALVLSMCRGAWLGIAAGVAVVVAASRSAKVFLVALVLLVAFYLIIANVPGAIDRLESIVSLERNQDRIVLWTAGLRMIKDRPLVGFGMDNFSVTYDRYAVKERETPELPPFAHNIFIDLAVSGGIPGLILISVILLGPLALGVRHLILRRGPRDLVYALALLVVQFTHMQVDLVLASPLTMPLLLMPLGVLIRHFEGTHQPAEDHQR